MSHFPLTQVAWQSVGRRFGISFTCAFCGVAVAAELGIHALARSPEGWSTGIELRFCPGCMHPTVFWVEEGERPKGQLPPPPVRSLDPRLGKALPTKVRVLTQEVIAALAMGAPTLAALGARTLLTHVAAEQGAPKGTFQQNVSWLLENAWIPPNGRGWVDRIRTQGNEVAHDLELVAADEAGTIWLVVETLLRNVYQMSTVG